jgi:PAS domain S-box-containing protein
MKPASSKQPVAKGTRSRKPGKARAAKSKAGHYISEREFVRLQDSLREAQDTLDAIRSGAVDAVVVSSEQGNQIYSLAGAEQPYRIYVEQMQEGALTVSKDGLILYCNQRFSDMLGVPLARVISATIEPYLDSATWESISHVFHRRREAVKHECELRRPTGSALAVHLTASRLPMADQEVMCVVVTDLTEQKSQLELRLAKDVAEKANLAKDSFLAALSHELRTPLTPVLMAAVTLEQNHELPDHVRRDLAMIRRNVELEARLIDDLLDLTRIAKGKLELRPASIDLHNVLRRALEICRPDITAKHQHLTFKLEATSVETTGDSVRLQQVFWNLIRNAIKFTPDGGSISIRTGNSGADSIWIEVRDSGIGFQPDESHKLFQAFEQGGRHITRQFGGLGLGLAISMSILEAHGGSIRAESQGLNLGATFTIELPIRLSSTVNVASTPSTPNAKEARRLRILLVEDHKDTRASLQLYLQRAKNEVKAAEGAQQALELAADNKFDLVVSDLGLPDEGGGLAMMRQLRQQYGLKGIAISGYGMEEDIVQSREAGFAHHLTKPISLERLKNLIGEISRQP